ncbi:MAG TPA: hypothetical protein VNP04_28625 [Alphaproteobacteria bacterium]|nr:hypothetical protein [Alphaproteobacteria bacterium]
MKTLLILTVGQTDVQLVKENQRHKLDGNICGCLHDTIKQRSWSLVEPPSLRSRDIIQTLPEGELKLCTPKLDAVLAHLGNVQPLSTLIFETNREGPRDPRLAGEIVERRLRDRGAEDVTRVAFLTDKEQLEDPACNPDAVVRREVVKRLSDAISNATENLTLEDRVFVATTGGLAAANELINELVRLHCVGGPSVTALEVPDGDRGGHDDRAVEEKFHPAAGIRARWHALSLIQNGGLLAAWGAVSHLEGKPGQEWTKVVRWLADFAASLPIADKCDIDVLKHPKMAVRAALRVEMALRARDIPRAVHGTVAFFEAALWDHLLKRVKRHNDPSKRRWFRFLPGKEPTGDLLLRKNNGSEDDQKRPFIFKETADGSDWYWIDDSEICAIRIAKHYLNLNNLTKFGQAIAGDIHKLRNDVAHNEPTPELMHDARRRMQEANLWSPKDEFLAQDLVREVLGELGVENPEELCKELIAKVRSRLLSTSETN